MNDRVTIISADCHGGASKFDYKPYLESSFHEAFDEWAGGYDNPYKDLLSDTKNRNYDNDRRISELHADGVVAEVVFPNTVPPFFPTGQHIAQPPSDRSYTKRLAGLRAHNRWLVDFCAVTPGRRAGLPQLLLNDIDDAIADANLAAENGFTAMLVPHLPPDSTLRPFFTDDYDRLWAAMSDLDLTITMHGGTGFPRYHGSPHTPLLMLMEVPFYAQKTVWHFILSGVFERFPKLRMVLTEQGVQWVPELLERMDAMWHQMTSSGNVGELSMPADVLLPKAPSEYFNTNCWIGASFPSAPDARAMRQIGLDRVMWGSDYPHIEGTYPLTRESLRITFEGWTDEEKAMVLGGNAAELYRFDLDVVDPLAAIHGPTFDELRVPLPETPDHESPAFTRGR